MAKEFFKNLPDTSTPLNASRLNGLLNGNEAMGNIVVGDVKCKNLFDGILELGTISGDTGLNVDNENSCRSKNYTKVNANTTYTLNNNNNYVEVVYFYDENLVYLETTRQDTVPFTFTTPDNTAYLKFRSLAGNVENDLTTQYQLEVGTTATEYTPYKAFGIESGSNENGSWVKFEDGTLMQYGGGEFSTGGTQEDSYKQVMFPLPFANANYIIEYTNCYNGDQTLGLQVHLTASHTYGNNGSLDYDYVYRRYSFDSDTGPNQTNLYKTATRFNWKAIGRWK